MSTGSGRECIIGLRCVLYEQVAKRVGGEGKNQRRVGSPEHSPRGVFCTI